jgi:tRNA threonylcarbamoyladenosine biosynthesis protein TsaE
MLKWSHTSDETCSCQAHSEDQTLEAGQQIAALLRPGDVVALIGELGAGKTRFVKAVAHACGVPLDEVNSPTFTLIHEYEGRVRIRHCDTYRLRTAEEFADLSLDELFAPDGIALVEWADRVVEYLPRDRLEIRIAIDSPTERTIELTATGKRSRQILLQLSKS